MLTEIPLSPVQPLVSPERPATATRLRARRGEGDRLREEILDAAQRLLVETEDADCVSIRAIGQAVGVTAPSIYRHFDDKDVLIRAVSERSFLQWDELAAKALEEVDDPLSVIRTLAQSFLQFGLKHPGPYRVMMMTPSASGRLDHLGNGAGNGPQACLGAGPLITAARAASEQGLIDESPEAVGVMVWTAVHGVISLHIVTPQVTDRTPEAQLDQLLDAITTGVLTKSGRTLARGGRR